MDDPWLSTEAARKLYTKLTDDEVCKSTWNWWIRKGYVAAWRPLLHSPYRIRRSTVLAFARSEK